MSWTYEVAYHQVKELSDSPSLRVFLRDELSNFHDPISTFAAATDLTTAIADEKGTESAHKTADVEYLMKTFGVKETSAHRIVNSLSVPYTRKDLEEKFYSERLFKLKLIGQLFFHRYFNRELFAEEATNVIAEEKFVPNVMKGIASQFKVDRSSRNEEYILEMLDLLLISLFILPVTQGNLIEWLEICAENNYFVSGKHTNASGDSQIVILSTLVSLVLLNDDRPILSEGSIFDSPQILIKINDFLKSLTKDFKRPLIIFQWGLILDKISIKLEESEDDFSLFVSSVEDSDLKQYSAKLIQHAASHKVLMVLNETYDRTPEKYRSILFSLLKQSLPYFKLTSFYSSLIGRMISDATETGRMEFLNDVFAENFFKLSVAKVPLQLYQFLALRSGIGAPDLVEPLQTYLMEVPASFTSYQMVDNSSTIVSLQSPLETGLQFTIPPGTLGEILQTPAQNSQMSSVILWKVPYNGWALLGRYLSIHGLDENGLLILRVLTSSISLCDDDQQLTDLLEIISDGVGHDFFDWLCAKFDESVTKRKVAISKVILEFLITVAKSSAARIWGIIGLGQIDLFSILPHEISAKNYDRLLLVIDIFVALIQSAIDNCLKPLIANKLQAQGFTSNTRTLIQIFESFCHWNYIHNEQQTQLATKLISVFTLVTGHYHECNEIFSVFQGSSEVVISSFLSTSESALRLLQPITSAIVAGKKGVVGSYIEFVNMLVKLRSQILSEVSMLEKKLFSLSGDLVNIYSKHYEFHGEIIETFSSLLSAKWVNQPSLLAYLGADKSQLFLTCLSNSLKIEPSQAVKRICKFVKIVLKSKQKGLAILLLDGKHTTSNGSAQKNGAHVESESLLRVLERLVPDCNNVDEKFALLDALLMAYSLRDIQPSMETFEKIVLDSPVFANDNDSESNLSDYEMRTAEVYIDMAKRNATAAKALEIVAIQMLKKQIMPTLPSLETLFTIDGFRSSLHYYLAKNFESKWQMPLVRFRSQGGEYGYQYVYNVDLLDKIMLADGAWAADYRSNVLDANLNLMYVDSRMQLSNAVSLYLIALTKMYGSPKFEKSVGEKYGTFITYLYKAIESYNDVPLLQRSNETKIDSVIFVLNFLRTCDVKCSLEDSGQEKLLGLAFSLFLKSENGQFLKIMALVFKMNDMKDPKRVVHYEQLLSDIFVKVCVEAFLFYLNQPDSSYELLSILSILKDITLLVPGYLPSLETYNFVRAIKPEYRQIYFSYISTLVSQSSNVAARLVKGGLFSLLIEDSELHEVLPVVLLLLEKLGSRVLPKVFLFMNSFLSEFHRILDEWTAPVVTSELIQQTSQILLLINIVEIVNDERLDVFNRESLSLNLEYLLLHRRVLAGRVQGVDVERAVSEITELHELLGM